MIESDKCFLLSCHYKVQCRNLLASGVRSRDRWPGAVPYRDNLMAIRDQGNSLTASSKCIYGCTFLSSFDLADPFDQPHWAAEHKEVQVLPMKFSDSQPCSYESAEAGIKYRRLAYHQPLLDPTGSIQNKTLKSFRHPYHSPK